MTLAAAIRAALGAANAATASLQVDVQHQQWVGQDEAGGPTYDVPVPRKAFLLEGASHAERPDGSVVVTKAKVGFAGPIEHHGADGRQEPIDPRDLFALPSGLEGHAIDVPGTFVNPETGAPYVRTVWLA